MNSQLTDWQKKVRAFLHALSGIHTRELSFLPARVLSFGDARGIHPFVLCVWMCGELVTKQSPKWFLDGNSNWAEAWSNKLTDAKLAAHDAMRDLSDFIENNY